MTWSIKDIIPSPTTTPDSPFTLPTAPAVPPQPALPPLWQDDDADDLALRAWAGLSPVARDEARRLGYVPPGEWERWRMVMTRGIDGVL